MVALLRIPSIPRLPCIPCIPCNLVPNQFDGRRFSVGLGFFRGILRKEHAEARRVAVSRLLGLRNTRKDHHRDRPEYS